MTTPQRVGIRALCLVCLAETASIIAYYGAPVIRMALAASVGLVIVIGMVSALRAARRGDLLHDHRHGRARRPPAKVYQLPQPPDRRPVRADDTDYPRRVIRLYDR